jgi:hypothetical protein
VFGCKVTMSRNVIRVTMDVESNFTAKVQEAQIIKDSSKKL